MNSLSPPTFQGLFWQPSTPETKVPGTLRCVDDGTLKLEVLGTLSGKPIDLDTVGTFTVFGLSEKGRPVTLERCFFQSRNANFPGLARSTIHVNGMLIGCHLEQHQETAFDEIEVHSEAFDKWFQFGTISVSHPKPHGVSLSFMPPEEPSWTLDSGILLSLRFEWSSPAGRTLAEGLIKVKTWVRFKATQATKIPHLHKVAKRFADFVSFAVDQTLPLHAIRVYSDSLVEDWGGGVTRRTPIEVYYSPTNETTYDSSRIAPPFSILSYESIRERFGEMVSLWFRNYEALESSFNLYFATKLGRSLFLENRFLMLSQAVETLHRIGNPDEQLFTDAEYCELRKALTAAVPQQFKNWLEGKLAYGNEPNLRRRLKRLFAAVDGLFPQAIDISAYITRLVDARNYFTHYNPSLKNRAAGGGKLYELCVGLEILFQGHLALLCGLSREQILEVFAKSEAHKRRSAAISGKRSDPD